MDYSCLHYQSWLLNVNNANDVSSIFSTNTDIVVSYGTAGTTNVWTVTSNQIPYYFFNFSSAVISSLNSRPTAATDFSGSGGLTTAVVGRSYPFGSNVGFTSGSCGLGYWPSGTAVCPLASSTSLQFKLKPAPEISTGSIRL